MLTESGKRYSAALSRFMDGRYPAALESAMVNGNQPKKLEVWTSMLRRSIDMAEYLSPGYTYKHSAFLDEFYAGEFDRLSATHDEQDHQTRTALLVERLRPLIIELERIRHSVLIVARDAVLSVLYSYFFDVAPNEALKQVRIPEHVLVGLRPMPFGTEVVCYTYDDTKDAFVEHPSLCLHSKP
jgi:6-phosphofructo-2-kinase